MIVRTGLVKVSVAYSDAIFHMRELSTREEADIAVKSTKSPGSALKMKFTSAITSWEKVEDNNGTLPCNTENKRFVFDANQELAENVLRLYMEAVVEKKENEKKISKTGAAGTSEKESSTVKLASV